MTFVISFDTSIRSRVAVKIGKFPRGGYATNLGDIVPNREYALHFGFGQLAWPLGKRRVVMASAELNRKYRKGLCSPSPIQHEQALKSLDFTPRTELRSTRGG